MLFFELFMDCWSYLQCRICDLRCSCSLGRNASTYGLCERCEEVNQVMLEDQYIIFYLDFIVKILGFVLFSMGLFLRQLLIFY